jgi:RecB family endonuclease NucS
MSNIIETIGIPALLAFFTILVMVILHIRSKKKKKLTCILFPSLSLVDIRTEVKDRIKIYYDEKLVENLLMTKVKLIQNQRVLL